jgi:hypothetical protein
MADALRERAGLTFSPLYGSPGHVGALYAAVALLACGAASVLHAHNGGVRSTGPITYHCASSPSTARAGCACERADANGSACSVRFELVEALRGPAVLSYELWPFYQNHRRYVDSWSPAQLAAAAPLPYAAVEAACSPRVSAHNAPDETPFRPCGLAPHARFVDRFTLRDASGAPLPLAPAAPPRGLRGYAAGESADAELGALLTWLRASPLPCFRKAYAQLDGGLAAGSYTMDVALGRGDAALAFASTNAAFSFADRGALGGRHATLAGLAAALCALAALASALCLALVLDGSGSPLQRAAADLGTRVAQARRADAESGGDGGGGGGRGGSGSSGELLPPPSRARSAYRALGGQRPSRWYSRLWPAGGRTRQSAYR